MKKLLTLLMALASTICINAEEITDAKPYFDGKPFGWATCSNEAGDAYQLDGGMRAAQPKTIILTSNGADNANNIINAIASYDIIVLDGSKGDFVISAQMGINNAKNKTIVGRNNARICTEFYLTDEDINYLEQQNLEGLSSTDQYTGTLPDGTTLTCDKRAFFTKKAMMELSFKKKGKYELPNKAGGIALSSSDENIIIRNITFVGPGACDIDGVDLITNQEAKHVWVDHCTFVDGQDGNLDSKRCDYVTYTWNKFYYTDRTFSHPYSNGCGWVSNHSMTIHMTWAYNEWGNRCARRLPQADDSYVHLLNNYHNCPGNSVGMTLNSYVKVLAEGNYAASGVNSPFTGSGANRKVTVKNNSFNYKDPDECYTVTMPYIYNKVEYAIVPELLHAKHGVGATLDYFMPGEEKELSTDNFGFYSSSADALVGNKVIVPLKNHLGAKYNLTVSDPSIASLGEDGMLSALKEGTVTITATVDDDYYNSALTSTMTVNITAPNTFQTIKKWDFKLTDATKKALSEDGDWSVDGTYTYNVDITKDKLTADGEEIPEFKGLLFSSPGTKFQIYGDGRIRLNKENTCVIFIEDVKKDDKVKITWKSASSASDRGFKATNLSMSQFLTNGTQKTIEASVLEDGEVTLTATGGIYVYNIELCRQSGTTGISNASNSNDSTTTKTYFNLLGQKVSKSATGLKIEKGKKTISRWVQ